MSQRLIAAIPKLASLDMERSLAFFERLGFKRRGSYPDYGIIERDGVQIHFWLQGCPHGRHAVKINPPLTGRGWGEGLP